MLRLHLWSLFVFILDNTVFHNSLLVEVRYGYSTDGAQEGFCLGKRQGLENVEPNST
jgi:hypothetical protein